MFGTRYGKRVEEEVLWAGRGLIGTFSNFDKLKESRKIDPQLEPFIKRYIDKCIK
jgi:hypothetical protein